ncbi:hypothetical protein LCGC14_0980530 [marine sediment metagenome]|uniref:Pectinesterase catalytic domain-containing protein n=1 Tax=marine sediment metagenome TaxID=412755 RepID=A0A0F9NDA6_9ZZZZ
MTSPIPGVIAFARRRNLRSSTGVPTSAPVDWRNVVIVDQDGGGDFTTIQAAINSITGASITNAFVVLVMGGQYIEATITMKSFVVVRGIIGGGEGSGVVISVTNASGGAIVDADNSGFEDIFINAATTGSLWTLDIDQTRLNWHMKHTRVAGRSRLGSGTYDSCTWTGNVNLNGSAIEILPRLYNNQIFVTGSTSGGLTSGATNFGHITGGSVIANLAGSSTVITLGVNIVCTGVNFVNDRAGLSTRDWGFTCKGQFVGCSFTVYDQAATGSSIITLVEGTYSGCIFNGIGITATPSSTSGPLTFSGCTWDMTSLGNNTTCVIVSGNSFARTVFSGCIFRTSGATGICLSASSANALVELNGNTYLGRILPTNLRLRGTDVKAEFFPVDYANGTGASVVRGTHPSHELNTALETAFIIGRINPPADVDDIVDARLMVSGEFDKAEDSFTDTNGTALAAHTADTGEAWTLISGTASISSNKVSGSNGGIHTFGAGADTSFLQALMVHGGTVNVGHGLIFRYSDASNYWRIELKERATASAIDLRLIKRVAASETLIASTPVGVTNYTGIIGVSFFGDDIKVFCDTGVEEPGLVFETTSTFNNTATVIGLKFGGGGLTFDDLAFWRGDTTLDLTVDTEFGQENSPLDELADSLVLANQPVAHRVFTYLDVREALTGVKQGSIIGMRVTLDALGTVNTALRIHGLLLRTTPTSKTPRPYQAPADGFEFQQVTYR